MTDTFSYTSSSLESPAESAFDISPDDNADLTIYPRALLLSADASVTVDMLDNGTNITLPLRAGFNPVRVRRVYATGTDAVTIVGLY